MRSLARCWGNLHDSEATQKEVSGIVGTQSLSQSRNLGAGQRGSISVTKLREPGGKSVSKSTLPAGKRQRHVPTNGITRRFWRRNPNEGQMRLDLFMWKTVHQS